MEYITFYFLNLTNSPVNITYFNATNYFNGFTDQQMGFYLNNPNILNIAVFRSLTFLLAPQSRGNEKG